MYCKNCGHKLPDDSKFCIKCGSPVNQINTIQSNSTNAELTPIRDILIGKKVEFYNKEFKKIEQGGHAKMSGVGLAFFYWAIYRKMYREALFYFVFSCSIFGLTILDLYWGISSYDNFVYSLIILGILSLIEIIIPIVLCKKAIPLYYSSLKRRMNTNWPHKIYYESLSISEKNQLSNEQGTHSKGNMAAIIIAITLVGSLCIYNLGNVLLTDVLDTVFNDSTSNIIEDLYGLEERNSGTTNDLDWSNISETSDNNSYDYSKDNYNEFGSVDNNSDTNESVTDNSMTNTDTYSQQDSSYDALYNYYILPSSNSAYLCEADLYGLTDEELRIARNEILARRGRMFKSEDLDTYFRSMSWYYPTIAADKFSESILNEYELYNLYFIKDYENSRKESINGSGDYEELYAMLQEYWFGTWQIEDTSNTLTISAESLSGNSYDISTITTNGSKLTTDVIVYYPGGTDQLQFTIYCNEGYMMGYWFNEETGSYTGGVGYTKIDSQ